MRLIPLPTFAALLVFALPAGGCGPSQPTESSSRASVSLGGRLTIAGSSTVAPLVGEIAKRFEMLHPDVRIDVQTGGSSRGIADVALDRVDIGMTSRELRTSEMTGVRSHVLAIDGVAMLVHADNTLTGLTDDQVRDLLRGVASHWSQIGGSDRPVTLVNRANGRGETDVVLGHLGLDPAQVKPDLVAGENQHAIKTVASDPAAVTFISLGAAELEAQRGVPIKLLAWNGVPATIDHVAAERFPVRRRLILVTADAPRPLVAAFVDFARSDQIMDLVARFGFAPAPQ